MLTTLAQGARFTRGLRSIIRHPVTVSDATARLRTSMDTRGERFLQGLDDLVWSIPSSPYLKLFAAAGAERGDVRRLVEQDGLEGALEALRDRGVYVAHEEWQGTVPAQRGSQSFAFSPSDFFNPRTAADFMGSTGGSRSAGTPVALSFSDIRAHAFESTLVSTMWDTLGVPTAVWLPVLPSAAGLTLVLARAATGHPPNAWFSQIDPAAVQTSRVKRAVNDLLPATARLSGMRLPRPVFVPPSDPGPVLDWVTRTLRDHGRAYVFAYASSGLSLGQAAWDTGQRLDGLVLLLTGEPVTAAKVAAVKRTGARVINAYGSMQLGLGAINCPSCPGEQLHLAEHEVALTTRRRERSDGVEVDALLWTSLRESSRNVLINVENDDYATVLRDDVPCSCAFGQAGVRVRIENPRGVSKVVAAGVTIRGEVFERLVETTLPERFGGGPGDYQFVEEEVEGQTRLSLRVNPRLVDVSLEDAVQAVREVLRRDEFGRLADDVWDGIDTLRAERATALRTRSGKTLPLEVLR